MIRYSSHWNRKLMIHFQATIRVDKHAVNIFNLELFHHKSNYFRSTSWIMNRVLIMTLIISQKNAKVLLKLVSNITFYNKRASFLRSVMKLSLFHQDFSKIILIPIRIKCTVFYASEKICICWNLKRTFAFYNCKEDKILFSDFFFCSET